MKTKSKTAAIGIMLLYLSSPSTRGQAKIDESTPSLPPGVIIRMEAHPKSATIGDPIRLDVDITAPPGYRAEVPRPVAQSGDFFVTDFAFELIPPQIANPPESGTRGAIQTAEPVRYLARITIAIYKTGKFVFPSMPVKIRTAEGAEIDAKSPPVEIEIRSVLTEKDPKLKDLKKQAEIQEPVRWLLWILLAAAACVLCAAAWYHRRRRRRRPVPLTPAQTLNLLDIAETDLRNLLARGFPDGGREKQFYVALSEIVKRILEAGYGIHTTEQTTSEIMDALSERPAPGSEHRGQIDSFLTRCDVVKFAKYIPARHEHEDASQEALGILNEARKAVSSR